MNKKLVVCAIGAVAAITLISCGLRSKKTKQASASVKHSANNKQAPQQVELNKSTLDTSRLHIIGDSQVARHIGTSAQEVMRTRSVTFFGKPGYTVEKYLGDEDALSKALNFDADVVYVQLGDNGVSNRKDKTAELVSRIRNRNPNVFIIWGGPMKAVAPTIDSSYVSVSDTQSARYLPTYNETRKTWTKRLKDALENENNVLFIDNYALQEAQSRSSTFSDARKGDGVHLTKDSSDMLMHMLDATINNLTNS